MCRSTLLLVALLLLPGVAVAQATAPSAAPVQMPSRPAPPTVPGASMPDMHRAGDPAPRHDGNSLLHDLMGQTTAARPLLPRLPGNDAFGAVQEILAILEADPKTDWNRVDLDALRAHLIDMNELALNAVAKVEPVGGGIRVTVTGQGRALAAIQRMVPAHAGEIDGHDGWHVTAEDKPDGAVLTVTAKDARQTAKIRGLGFIGVMATGAHHQLHHLAIARGQRMPHGAGHGHAMPKAN